MSFLKKFFHHKPNTYKEDTNMTNKDKALALINTFATGDTDAAKNLLAEGYIQHNLAYGTGRDAFLGSVTYLASAPVKTTVNNIRAFEDGDKVFMLQFVNVKIYMFGVTALTGYVVGYMSSFPALLFFELVIATIGTIATCTWIGLGVLIQKFYLRHFRVINIILALTLLECIWGMLR